MQRIQRDRAFYKIYFDFLEAARKGSIAIINKSIPPLNPMDEDYQHVFVYNQIFFSFAVDNMDDFKDVSSSDSNPTYTATNHDILGLKTLQALDIDGLHIIATCHVNYKGHRVIAQSIIPGILTNTDQSTLTEFGSVDDGKTIHTNPEFCELMKQVCNSIAAKESTILDGDGNPHTIPGSIDVKGIKGTDKRKYLLDIVRITPRDSNYKGENFTSCLVRPELLRIYQKTKDLEQAIAKINEEKEKQEKAAAEGGQPEGDKKEEEKQTTFVRDVKKFNLNVYTNTKLADGDYKEDIELVDSLATFITDVQIPKIIKAFENGYGVPTDNETLKDMLHSNGINMRYLGRIYNEIKSEHLPHIKNLIERSII